MGPCVESPAPELVSVSRQGPGEGTTGGGFVREAQPLEVDLLSRVSAPECKASEEKKRTSWAVRQEEGNLLKGERG